MPITPAPPSSRGRSKDDRISSVIHNARVDSFFLTSRNRKNREPLLTGCRVPAKTENVSELPDKITGDYLRLQFFYAQKSSENCSAKAANRRAAQPRAHSGSGERGIYPVRR